MASRFGGCGLYWIGLDKNTPNWKLLDHISLVIVPVLQAVSYAVMFFIINCQLCVIMFKNK